MRKIRRVFIFYQLRNQSLHATSRACVCAQLTRVTLTLDVDDTERTPTTIETELRLSKHTTAITTTADVMCASEHTKAQ